MDLEVKHPRRWSDAYGRSELGLGVWYDRRSGTPVPAGAVRGIERTKGRTWQMSTESTAIMARFGDGGTFEFDSSVFEYQGMIGCWIVGWGVLRYSCLIRGLEAPARRFKHEPFVPEPEALVRCVQESVGTAFPGEYHDTWGWVRERRVLLPADEAGSGAWGRFTPRARWFWQRLAELQGFEPEPEPREEFTVCRL